MTANLFLEITERYPFMVLGPKRESGCWQEPIPVADSHGESFLTRLISGCSPCPSVTTELQYLPLPSECGLFSIF